MPPTLLTRLHRLPVALLATLAAMATIFAMSAQHRVPVPPGFSDKVISTLGHFAVYFVLAVLLYWTLTFVMATGPRLYAAAWGLAVLYGISDEWHQSFVPGRTPDVVDLVTDAAGAAVGLLFVWWITPAVAQTAAPR
jgi:VanZ family protein